MFTKGNVTKTIYLSLFVQIVTSLVSLDGVDIHLDKNNLVLQDILKLELFVQLVEGIFYVWIIYGLKDFNKMTFFKLWYTRSLLKKFGINTIGLSIKIILLNVCLIVVLLIRMYNILVNV